MSYLRGKCNSVTIGGQILNAVQLWKLLIFTMTLSVCLKTVPVVVVSGFKLRLWSFTGFC